MLRHGSHPPENRQGGSIQTTHSLHQQGRTPDCVHHSDRGWQYASEVYRTLLAAHGLVGSMSRRGNPYDNAKAESFAMTLKVEAV